MTDATASLSEKALFLPREAAEVLRVSRSTIYRMCGTGDLESKKVRGSLRISRESLVRLLYIDEET